MLISKTPFRISFFGGGTDLPHWYENNCGAVISTTINKYCYISCRGLPALFEYKHRLVYSSIEVVNETDDIIHPGIRGVFQFLCVCHGLEIHHDGDLPARAGLGSSSSFTVGLLNAIQTMYGLSKDAKTLAQQAIHVERDVLGEFVGSQDQVAASYGGFNHICFLQDGSFDVTPSVLNLEAKNILNDHLMLVFTGIRRHASEIEKTKIKNISTNRVNLDRIANLVLAAEKELLVNTFDISNFGEMLHETWEHKKALAREVSTAPIDELYEVARANGAIGGKLLGAGGGGFLLLLAPPNRHAAIKKAFKNLWFIDFKFEEEGATVIRLND